MWYDDEVFDLDRDSATQLYWANCESMRTILCQGMSVLFLLFPSKTWRKNWRNSWWYLCVCLECSNEHCSVLKHNIALIRVWLFACSDVSDKGVLRDSPIAYSNTSSTFLSFFFAIFFQFRKLWLKYLLESSSPVFFSHVTMWMWFPNIISAVIFLRRFREVWCHTALGRRLLTNDLFWFAIALLSVSIKITNFSDEYAIRLLKLKHRSIRAFTMVIHIVYNKVEGPLIWIFCIIALIDFLFSA